MIAALAIATCIACGGRRAELPAPERILLVSIDTLRADHIGCYGAERAATRTLDTLAAAGVRFEAAVSPAPLTLPAHASLLTALDPPGHGVRHNGIFRLPDAIPTLAERLREAGLVTGAVVGSQVLDRRHGLERGFDFYDDRLTDRIAGGSGWPERRADRVVDAALALLDRLGPRFLLWVHFYDPHMAYDPPAGFASAFSSRRYDGEIAFADFQLGRLLRAMRERWGETGLLIVVTSDHGESFGEHGDLTHSYLLYETTQHIPLIFAGPGIPAGRTVAAPVGLVDVAPTLLALARAKPLPDTAGRDLSPLLTGEAAAPANAYFETLAPQLDFGWSPLLGLRAGSFKYIRAPRPELYDLAADPGETRSLAAERPELVASLDAELDARLRASPGRAATPLAPTPAEREALAALGYLAPTGASAGIALGQVGGVDPKDRLAVIFEVQLAQVSMAEGKADQALARLRALGDAGPAVAGLRAAAAVNAGEPAAAERDARAALAVLPGRSDLRSVLALALDAQGRGDEAVAELRRLPADHPLPAAVALRVAAAEAADAEIDTALRRIERALEGAPDDPRLLRGRGLLLARNGSPREGSADALALPPTDAGLSAHLHYLCAEALFELGRIAEARRALDQALAYPEAGASEWRSGASALRSRLDSRAPPPGARGKKFSLNDGKRFPRGALQRFGRLRLLERIAVKSATYMDAPVAPGLAPELHQDGRPKGS